MVINRFRKCVAVAKEQGFVFSSLEDFEYKDDLPDEMINLCKGIKGKIHGFINNFNRFYGIGRLTPKYYIVTRGFILFMILLFLLFIILYLI